MNEKYHTAGAKLKHCKVPLILVSSLLVLLLQIFTGISLTHAATVTYTYDNLHRLSKVDYGNGMVIDYNYDAAGNRTSEIVSAGSVNTVPLLSYSSESGYGSDGVNPDSGTASATFTYKVIYTDANNNPPASIKVHIDGDASGISMSVDATAASTLRDANYTNGEQYYYTTYLGVGTHNYYFDASDGTDSARLPSIGTLNGPAVSDHINNPPSLIPIGAKSVNEGTNLNFMISGSDPDGDLLTYSATGLPTGATFDVSTRTFNWTPDFTQAGYYSVTFTVSDGSATASETLTITVNDVNDTTPPITTASPAGGTYTFAQNVALSANESATIYYTTDGTPPTTSSPVYSGPINILTTTTLKFFAVDNAGNNEVVKTATYTIILFGLLGEYYNNSDFTAPMQSHFDSTINFDWGTGSPSASIDPDSFSVRWTGKLKVDNNEIYTFHAITDDGIRLWIDGHLVLNYWTHGGVSTSDTMDLTSGLHDIKIEFYEDTGSALAQLYWSSSSTLYGIIPNDHLQPPAVVGSPPVLTWANDTGYVSDGVEPQTGDTTTLFTYRVKYTDADGDSPMNSFPRVHILKGGKEVSGSPFVMDYEIGNYIGGAIYRYTATLPAGIDYTYYFDAKDNMGLQAIATAAAPTPVAPVDAPDVDNGAVTGGIVKLPQTGQTTCYDSAGAVIPCAGTGQDGEIRAGVSWPSPRFTDNDNSTVTDNLTGLMWTKDGNAPGPSVCSPAATKTWQSALDYVACLNTNSYLGYTDWRLPNVLELESLINSGQSNSATYLNTQGFNNVQSFYYWSSTSSAYESKFAWVVHMSGDMNTYYKFNGSYVWAVRSGQSGTIQLPKTGQTACFDSAGNAISCTGTGQDGDLQTGVDWTNPRFTVSGDCVTDSFTGMMWMKDANLIASRDPGFDSDGTSGDGAVTWQHALDYVKGVSLCGYADWRLPNKKELQSLSDFSQFIPALPSGHPFQNVQSITYNYYGYWSSSTFLPVTDLAWFSFMWFGAIGTNGKANVDNYYVWPVRSGQVGTPNTAPILSYSSESGYVGDGISPDSGTASTTFIYKVIYTDTNNNPPPSIKVHIDGDTSGILMSMDTTAASILRDGDYTNGEQYYYAIMIAAGTHNYYFDASDGINTTRLPSSGAMNGPIVNAPPVLNPIGTKSVKEGSLLSFTVSGSYPDGNVLSYGATGLPSGATFNTSTRIFSWTPGYKQAGLYSVTFIVSDGSLTDSETVAITVNDASVDLIVSTLTAPTTGVAGAVISISDGTRNQGTSIAGASTTKFYLSTNTTYDSGDILLGSRSVPSLAAGTTDSGTISVVIPPNVCGVTFYIIARADADGVVAETLETNNNRSRSIKIGTDLVVSTLTAPTTSGAGTTITISDTTRNSGGCTSGTSATDFYLSANNTYDTGDTYLGSRSVPALSAGTTDTGSTSVTIPANTSTGTYYIVAKADGANVVAETIETNNNKSKSIKLGPDLIISSLSAPSTSGAGMTITISSTTKNSGAGLAGASTTSYYLSANTTYETGDTYLGGRLVPSLAAGAVNSGGITVTIPAGTLPGPYYIIGRADADGVVSETNETNNIKYRLITTQ